MKKKYEVSIVNTVYEHRVLRRLSQQKLADDLGISKQTISVMERSDYSPSLALAFKIADYFGVPLTDIFHYKKGEQ